MGPGLNFELLAAIPCSILTVFQRGTLISLCGHGDLCERQVSLKLPGSTKGQQGIARAQVERVLIHRRRSSDGHVEIGLMRYREVVAAFHHRENAPVSQTVGWEGGDISQSFRFSSRKGRSSWIVCQTISRFRSKYP